MMALIVGRAFQGMAGGGLILLVHVCISDLFSLRYVNVFALISSPSWKNTKIKAVLQMDED